MVPAVLPSPKKFPTDLCLSGTRPKISQCISVTYDPGAFQTVASILGLRTNEFVRESVKSGISVLYSPLTLLEVWLTGFQSQMLWGLPFPVQVSQAGNCECGAQTSRFSGGTPCSHDIPSCLYVAVPEVWVLTRPHLCLYYLS